jgi:diacylglycerol O-acyltransferase
MTERDMTERDSTPADGWAELAHWGSTPELNQLDSLMWRTERPPAASWTGVVVQLLDSTPLWERLWRAHEWAIGIVPRFAERVVDPIIPTGPPMWSPDPHFDLGYHLRRIKLPAPGTTAQLLELAQTLGVTPLDRKRPPWVALFVEGLEDGRSAYVLQAHHVLMDGAGATQLFSRIFPQTPDIPSEQPPEQPARKSVSRTSAALHGLVGQLRVGPKIGTRLGSALTHVTADPAGSARDAAKYASSMLRVARPPAPASSSLLAGGSRTAWRFGTLECELDDLKKAGKAAGGTVNDAFVTAILGGLRRYHERHDVEMGDIPISMPVSVRRAGDPMGGNRFTGAFFAAPGSVADPADRIRAMRSKVAAVRDEPAIDFLNSLTPLMNLAPSDLVAATLSGLTSNAVLTTSSWPGVPYPTYIAGARFERMFVFGPLPGTAMCAALCTHVGVCCIALNVDGDVFPDIDVLWECMQQGLDEVLALAK